MHATTHANVSKCHKLFQHRTCNDTTVSVYMHLLKKELNGWTHPLSLSFWRLWFTWKTLTSAHTPSAEILLPLRLQKVRQQKREVFKLHHQCIIYLAKLTLYEKGSKTKLRTLFWVNLPPPKAHPWKVQLTFIGYSAKYTTVILILQLSIYWNTIFNLL